MPLCARNCNREGGVGDRVSVRIRDRVNVKVRVKVKLGVKVSRVGSVLHKRDPSPCRNKP